MAAQEWGPWIEHDGLGCPLPSGTIVEVRHVDAFGYMASMITKVGGGEFSSWNWLHYPELKKIIRYREKKPRGLEILEHMLQGLDTPVETHA
ncbi:MAG: hypothetical protein AAGA70_03140 [Pseudomonadota bacterium]